MARIDGVWQADGSGDGTTIRLPQDGRIHPVRVGLTFPQWCAGSTAYAARFTRSAGNAAEDPALVLSSPGCPGQAVAAPYQVATEAPAAGASGPVALYELDMGSFGADCADGRCRATVPAQARFTAPNAGRDPLRAGLAVALWPD